MSGPSLVPGMICPGETDVRLRLRVKDWPQPFLSLRSSPALPMLTGPLALVPVAGPGAARNWILDLHGLAPATTYLFSIDGHADSQVTIRTPPGALGDAGLLVALLSCYFPSTEYEANPTKVVQCLRERAGGRPDDAVPHLKILCGDQIYADVPAAWSFGRAEATYRQRYQEAWSRRRLGTLLSQGANLFVAEDHEFWNSFPDAMPYLARSGHGWHDWAKVAADFAWVEQGVWNFVNGFQGGAARQRSWGRCGLAPGVALFAADTRTDRVSFDGTRGLLAGGGTGERPPDEPRTMMGEDQLRALTSWADNEVERVGLLVLGQPLLGRTTSGWTFDTNLADYAEDYRAIVSALVRNIERRGVSFVVLTGDIHWGRLICWSPVHHPPDRPNAKLVEFVASPMARVGKVGSLLSREHGVGDAADTTIDDRDREPLRDALRHFTESPMFASNDNNFGLLRLTQRADDRYVADFELRSLRTHALAEDRWLHAASCHRTLHL